MRGIAKWQVLKATTTNPLIRDFRHLLPCPHRWFKIQDWANPRVQAVRPRDRIKYWNIAPGDSIVDRLDPSKTVEQVLAVNRFSNRVYLKGEQESDNGVATIQPKSKRLHYSRCQLYLGKEKFARHDGSLEEKDVYAIRLKTTNVRYDSKRKRFRWDRIPVVYPQLSNSSKLAMKLAKAGVPWPTGKKRQSVELNEKYDTPRDVVSQLTYVPPALPSKISHAIPKPASEPNYITSLFNPSPVPFDESAPLESHIVKELVNPFSRAKKQANWQAYQRYKDDLRKEMVGAELAARKKDGSARSAKEATAEGLYKWRQALEDEKRAKSKARWAQPSTVAKMERKNKSKDKKKRRKAEKLRDLVLTAAPNQFVPGAKDTKQTA